MRALSLAGAIGLLLAAAGGFWYFTIVIQGTAHDIEELRSTIKTLESRDEFVRVAERFLSDTRAEREFLQQFIAQSDDAVTTLALVEGVARRARVTAAISSATVSDSGDIHHDRLVVVVAARGTFSAQVAFITALESLPRASFVEKVELEAADSGWFGTYTISFARSKQATP